MAADVRVTPRDKRILVMLMDDEQMSGNLDRTRLEHRDNAALRVAGIAPARALDAWIATSSFLDFFVYRTCVTECVRDRCTRVDYACRKSASTRVYRSGRAESSWLEQVYHSLHRMWKEAGKSDADILVNLNALRRSLSNTAREQRAAVEQLRAATATMLRTTGGGALEASRLRRRAQRLECHYAALDGALHRADNCRRRASVKSSKFSP